MARPDSLLYYMTAAFCLQETLSFSSFKSYPTVVLNVTHKFSCYLLGLLGVFQVSYIEVWPKFDSCVFYKCCSVGVNGKFYKLLNGHDFKMMFALFRSLWDKIHAALEGEIE